MEVAKSHRHVINRIPCERNGHWIVAICALWIAIDCHGAEAAPVEVRYPEGVSQGFVTLSTLEGNQLGEGELSQSAAGADRVVSRLTLHFKDGSLHDETVLFSQKNIFGLLSYKLVQRGPTFPDPIEITLEAESGNYSIRWSGGTTEPTTTKGRLNLPPDIYNGMTVTLLKNLPTNASVTVHMLDFLPDPKLYAVELTPIEKESLKAGGLTREATHYVLKPKIGWILTTFAALFGKTLPRYHFWLLKKDVPAFVRFEGPLYGNGPAWRIEQASLKLRTGK
jgi:hypothetical protein